MSSEKIQIITFNCILKNKLGQLISSTYNRDVLTGTLESEALLQGLSLALQNIATGEKRCIELKAAEAYGFYDLKKVILFPRKNLPRQISRRTDDFYRRKKRNCTYL
jgi:FKBP-type peptidyl-prolyl cis-trans isomerase SlyD